MSAERRGRLQRLLSDRGADGALVTNPVNIRYLSGFTGSNGALLVDVDGPVRLITDGRYQDQAAAEAPDVDVIIDRELLCACARYMTGTWAVETNHLTVDEYRQLPSGTAGLDGAVESLRAIKDPGECQLLSRACQMSTRALDGLLESGLEGRTERELSRDLQWRIYELGADEIAFEFIIASGPNAAIPHHRPTDRKIRRGDFVKIDFGAQAGGYHADCTRTFVTGPAADWQREMYEVVRQSQLAGLDACVAGTEIRDVWNASVDVLADAGWREYFTTGLGHGVGLQIHEDPFIGPRRTGKLAGGMTVTIEPGVYVPGSGGVRIEDTLVVTENGARVLTTMTKDLVEI